MIRVVKILGKAYRANVDGEMIYRQEDTFIPSEKGWFRQMETENHFCYRRKRGTTGSTLMCTCGGIAGVFNYDAYQKFYDKPRGRLLCCVTLMQTGKHADQIGE